MQLAGGQQCQDSLSCCNVSVHLCCVLRVGLYYPVTQKNLSTLMLEQSWDKEKNQITEHGTCLSNLHTLVASSAAFPSILNSFRGLHGRQHLCSAWLCKAGGSCKEAEHHCERSTGVHGVPNGKIIGEKNNACTWLRQAQRNKARSYTLENRMWLQQLMNPGGIYTFWIQGTGQAGFCSSFSWWQFRLFKNS